MLSHKLTITETLWGVYLVWNTLPINYHYKSTIAKKVAKKIIPNLGSEEQFVHSCPACSYAIQQAQDVPFDVNVTDSMGAQYCRHCPLRALWFSFKDEDPFLGAPCESIITSPYKRWFEILEDEEHSYVYDVQFFALMIAEEALSEYYRLGGSNKACGLADEKEIRLFDY